MITKGVLSDFDFKVLLNIVMVFLVAFVTKCKQIFQMKMFVKMMFIGIMMNVKERIRTAYSTRIIIPLKNYFLNSFHF